ncbi:MAG TPA: zinc metallopeptidase [Fibrobacteraceae bacterium]|nr:zinc metallopeptidase [Fibrobacteraceae bacterium]
MFGFDPLYLIILVGTLALSGLVSLRVKSRFKAGQKIPILSGITGAQVAAAVIRDAGITDVQIVEHSGFLSDHYNPMTKTLALSHDVYHGRNASAAGVAAHESGHALQHAENYFPMWVRSAIVPAANIGSNLGPWLVIIGMLLGIASNFGHMIAVTGVLLFAAATFFTLVTVPVEFDASSRAKKQLVRLRITQEGEEQEMVSSVLTAAGMTYVAAAASSLAMLFYWALRAGLLGGRSDD